MIHASPCARGPRFLTAAIAVLLTAAGLASSPATGYRVTVRRTSFGIPHIVARDIGSLGFGEGYAAAEDHYCTILDQVIKARGDRSKFFGPGRDNEHLNSDVAARAFALIDGARHDLAAGPRELREWFGGYAAGLNRFLADVGVERVGGWCQGQPWLTSVTATDILARSNLISLAGVQVANEIAAAVPPVGARPTQPPERALDETPLASNGWAIGRERSATGRGMLLANPHYPWVGANRFWEKHLTIPGTLDVYGVSLIGMPGVAIGFNRHIAWTHTVSASRRVTLYSLKLVGGDPTSYVYGGQPRAMASREVIVDVRRDHGTVRPHRQTVYFSHYGPMVSLRGFEWTTDTAYTIRDANQDNDESGRTYAAMNRAGSLDEFRKALAIGGVTFVNTMAVSSDGRALYADTSSTPDLSEWAAEEWRKRLDADEPTRNADARGWILLDGSDSRSEWINDPGARDPGVTPFFKAPQLERRDYVFNANDSYWLPHASARLEGYSPVYGRERSGRSLRTRMNAVILQDTTPAGPSGADGRFSLDELTDAAFSNRAMASELLKPELVRRCRSTPEQDVDARVVDLLPACNVLASYDGRLNADSRGAVLWREFLGQFGDSPLTQFKKGSLFGEDFSAQDPIGTPRGLAPATGEGDHALACLARAILVLDRAGYALDIPLGDVQFTEKNGKRIPVHGGLPAEGTTNMMRYGANTATLEPDFPAGDRIEGSRFLTKKGYPVNYGTSFIMALEFTELGPNARALLTYSQSGNPGSPHYADQTELYARKQWRPILFTDEQIGRDKNLVTKVLTGSRGTR